MTTPGSTSRLAQLVHAVPGKATGTGNATAAWNAKATTVIRRTAGKLAPPGGNGVNGDQNDSRKANWMMRGS